MYDCDSGVFVDSDRKTGEFYITIRPKVVTAKLPEKKKKQKFLRRLAQMLSCVSRQIEDAPLSAIPTICDDGALEKFASLSETLNNDGYSSNLVKTIEQDLTVLFLAASITNNELRLRIIATDNNQIPNVKNKLPRLEQCLQQCLDMEFDLQIDGIDFVEQELKSPRDSLALKRV